MRREIFYAGIFNAAEPDPFPLPMFSRVIRNDFHKNLKNNWRFCSQGDWK
jgi:hypothetical protein